jgi:hypothetical protein
MLALLMVAMLAGVADANWRLYHRDKEVVASFDYLSRASFRGQPAVWVRWHYVTPRNGTGGTKLQFTANCPAHKLYEIESLPYDTSGNYLSSRKRKHYDVPKEYPLEPGSLNDATYKLLCR